MAQLMYEIAGFLDTIRLSSDHRVKMYGKKLRKQINKQKKKNGVTMS